MVNILTDLAMVAMPVLVVVDLQVNRNTKISLVLILSLGLLYVKSQSGLSHTATAQTDVLSSYSACAASVIRAVYAYSMTDPDYTRRYDFLIWFKYVHYQAPSIQDHGYTNDSSSPARSVELHAGIIAASLPTLRPLFSRILNSTTSYGRSTKQRGYGGTRGTGTGGGGGGGGQGNHVELSDMRHHPYYRAGESPFQAPKPGEDSNPNFVTQITTTARGGFGDESSEEFILAPSAGITKTTDITVS